MQNNKTDAKATYAMVAGAKTTYPPAQHSGAGKCRKEADVAHQKAKQKQKHNAKQTKQAKASSNANTAAKLRTGVLEEARSLTQRIAKMKAERVERLSRWTDNKDSKGDCAALDAAITALEASLATARGALSSAYGNRAVPFVLPISVTLVTSGSAGVLSAPATIDASTSTEWASLAALFDEYRVVRGTYDYMVTAPAGALTTSGATTYTPDSMFALGFDISDSTSATSVRNVCELQQHVLVASSMRYAGAAGSYSGVFEGKHRFHFEVARFAEFVTGSGANAPGQWKQTTAPGSDGFLKPFCRTLLGTLNDAAVVGVLYLTVHFRCRAN